MKWTRNETFSLANLIIAGLGFIFVILQMNKATEEFKHSQRNQKAQLLSQLHNRAFESEEMMSIFLKIEYDELRYEPSQFKNPEFHKSKDQQNLIELLSFFELLGELKNLELIKTSDISNTFGYYIIRVYQNKEVSKYREFLRTRAVNLKISSGGITFVNFERLADEILGMQS